MIVARKNIDGIDLSQHADIMQSTDTAWIAAQIRGLMLQTVQCIIRLAAAVRRMDELQCTVQVPPDTLAWLRKIGRGHVAPELFIALQGRTGLLKIASRLPKDQQLQIARNEKIPVMEVNGDHRLLAPLEMEAEDIKQVFDAKRDCIRSDEEQILWLRSKTRTKAIAEAPIRSSDEVMELDSSGGFVIVHQPCKISFKNIEMYYNAMLAKKNRKRSRTRQAA